PQPASDRGNLASRSESAPGSTAPPPAYLPPLEQLAITAEILAVSVPFGQWGERLLLAARGAAHALPGWRRTRNMSQPKSFKQSLPGLWRVLRHFWPPARQHCWLMARFWAGLVAEDGVRLLSTWPLTVVIHRVSNRMHATHGLK